MFSLMKIRECYCSSNSRVSYSAWNFLKKWEKRRQSISGEGLAGAEGFDLRGFCYLRRLV
jgi:hypothetical protein